MGSITGFSRGLRWGHSPLVCLGCGDGRGQLCFQDGLRGCGGASGLPLPPDLSLGRLRAGLRQSPRPRTEQPRDQGRSVSLRTSARSDTPSPLLYFYGSHGSTQEQRRKGRYLLGRSLFAFMADEKAPRSVLAPESGCGTPGPHRPLGNASFV